LTTDGANKSVIARSDKCKHLDRKSQRSHQT
jgi:hypothetical protein